jgi:glc operon protein GlcG
MTTSSFRFLLASLVAAAVLIVAGAVASAGETGARPPVAYFPSADVARAFEKGAVLVDGADGRNYQVHASHRDSAGMAEVHDRDTDIIYVLEGAAEFVTGGTVEGGRVVDTDEIRGAAIRGGETRRIVKGDVLIVPNGTPHWFRTVEGPLNYYVVKVR